MKTIARLAAVVAALLTPAAVFAQETVPAQEVAPAPAPAPALAPAPASALAPSDAPAQPALPAPVTIAIPTCRLAEHAGIDEASAQTAAQIVCDAIQHAGASPTRHYRVSLGRLGSMVVLRVGEEGDSIGSTLDSRSLRLQGIEEVPVAAPRIADSIVHGTSLHDTEKVDNLVGEETRQPRAKGGKTHFAMGLVGILPPLDRGLTPAPGLDLDVHYETSDQKLELGGSMRFGGASDNGDTSTIMNGFFVFSMGGRLYTSETDFSPYVGGGLTWSYLSLSVPGVFKGDGSGLGAYADAGVEVLRTHHTHLSFGMRLDAPFFAMHGAVALTSPSTCLGCGMQSTLYEAPLSLEMRLTF